MCLVRVYIRRRPTAWAYGHPIYFPCEECTKVHRFQSAYLWWFVRRKVFFAASYRRFFAVNATDIYDSVNPVWQGNSKKRENLLRTAVIRPGTCGYHIHLLSLWLGLLFFADKLIELFLGGQPVPQWIFHKFWIKKKLLNKLSRTDLRWRSR